MTTGSAPVRVRIAPSPTGPIHLGTVHTALFNWLFARQRGGVFILRFEDTDQARSERRWEDVMYEELRWLGLDWDEAPDCGGGCGPYRQTERLALYREWADRLVALGAAYECYCSADELAAGREDKGAVSGSYRYSRRCRDLDDAARRALRAEGRVPSIRFAVPDDEVVVVEDLIRGRIEFPTSAISDPIIIRPNGVALYNFAVVVDDLCMDVTHVLRGEGHISNTPLQMLIYRALGEAPPVFGHFGHVTSSEGVKFAKRTGEGYIGEFRRAGIIPEAMFNYLALLAWTPGDDSELMSREEILAKFAIDRVTAAPSQFNLKKLLWYNGNHLRRLDPDDFARRCLPYLADAGFVPAEPDPATLARLTGICALEQTRVEALAEIVPATEYYFRDELTYTRRAAKLIEREGAREDLALARGRFADLADWTVPVLEEAGRALREDLGKSARAVFQPIRAAVTGRTASPPLFDTLYWLGRAASLARLELAASGRPLPAAVEEEGA